MPGVLGPLKNGTEVGLGTGGPSTAGASSKASAAAAEGEAAFEGQRSSKDFGAFGSFKGVFGKGYKVVY